MRLFIPIVELTLFPIEAFSLLPKYAPYHPTFQNSMNMHFIVKCVLICCHT